VTQAYVIHRAALKSLHVIHVEMAQAAEPKWLAADQVVALAHPVGLKLHLAIHAAQLQAAALKSLRAILAELQYAAALQSLTGSRV
jgi:hypothetical protein